ncbi:hypothetical protein GCM10027259_53050 [Micromonospora palomenae]
MRLSWSPQTVEFWPGCQACTSPPGTRAPSGPISSLDAATAGVLLILIPSRFPPPAVSDPPG